MFVLLLCCKLIVCVSEMTWAFHQHTSLQGFRQILVQNVCVISLSLFQEREHGLENGLGVMLTPWHVTRKNLFGLVLMLSHGSLEKGVSKKTCSLSTQPLPQVIPILIIDKPPARATTTDSDLCLWVPGKIWKPNVLDKALLIGDSLPGLPPLAPDANA